MQNVGFYRPPEDSAGNAVPAGARKGAMGGPLPARHVKPIQITAPRLEIFKDALDRFARPRSFHHGRLRQRVEGPHEASRSGQADGADRARRSAHLRHGEPVPRVQHLRQSRPALQARRRQHPAVLQGSAERAGAGGGNHGSRLDVLLPGRPAPLTPITACP